MYLIPIDAVIVSNLLVIAVAASIKEDLLILVFFWVQNVVAFAAKFHSTHFRKLVERIKKTQNRGKREIEAASE